MHKLSAAPVLALFWFAESLPNMGKLIFDLAGITCLIAGVFVVARYKAALSASDAAGEAMERELDAEKNRGDRLQQNILQLETKVALLEQRPNLDGQALLLEKLINRVETQDLEMDKTAKMMATTLASLSRAVIEIRQATVPPPPD